MPKYIGIQKQISRNNFRSVLLLLLFPVLLIAGVWFFFFLVSFDGETADLRNVNYFTLSVLPWILTGTIIWFLIAWFSHSAMIKRATGSKSLERKDNKRIYNLVENLTISEGMKMPKVNIINDPALNAFASGINEKTYTVTLTEGIINELNDDELEGVIAHELAHIKNRDVRLMIIAIIFVGIFSFVTQILFRNILYGSMMGCGRQKKDGRVILIAMLIALLAYFLSITFRFAISRKREYMADATAAEMTKKPQALASALRKISRKFRVKSVKSEDVAEMFIENQPDRSSANVISSLSGLFSTHPPIEERIKVLEQY